MSFWAAMRRFVPPAGRGTPPNWMMIGRILVCPFDGGRKQVELSCRGDTLWSCTAEKWGSLHGNTNLLCWLHHPISKIKLQRVSVLLSYLFTPQTTTPI
mmetsp:Transcript_25633/g.70725  ORF Transcript_25633/g.70725 Transcript_25633/m.70725 type:complete len:99 (-) Transcript_25633:2140-2436(-)